MGDENEPRTVGKLSNEELDKLAFKIANNDIFITNDPEITEQAFGFILGMTAQDNFDREDEWKTYAESIGAVYEDMDQAMGYVNNIPMFFSAHMLNENQVEKLLEKIDEYEEELVRINPDKSVNDAV